VLVELREQLTDDPVELLQTVGVEAVLGLVLPALGQARPDMHAGRVVPEQERLVGLVRPVDEVERTGEQIVLDRLHALARQRARVLDRLFADTAEARILRRIINVRRLAVQHSTGLEERHRRVVARVIGLLGLVL
jgi:hypothetical protein